MASAPQTLTLKEHRDLQGKRWQRWVRRGLLALLAAILAAALANLFGQRPETSTAAGAAARLQVYAPERARGASSTRRASGSTPGARSRTPCSCSTPAGRSSTR